MEWLNSLTNGENDSAINLVLITLALAILLIVIVWVFRKITGSAKRRAMRSRVPRLSITDSTTVDDKRFLVMVRRDNVEHLLLIGGANDIVVEANIMRAQAPAKTSANTNTKQPMPSKNMEVVEEPKEDKTSAAVAPIAAATAAGAAGISGLAGMASNAAGSVSNSVSDAASSTVETVSKATKSATDTITDTASKALDVGSEAIAKTGEAVSDTVSGATAKVVGVTSPEPADQANIAESDLENAISAKLDAALSIDDINIEEAGNISPEIATADAASNEDEMQKLLDELSGETKEPA